MMKEKIMLFCWAMAISFVGTLPLGTLNLSVANYAFRHDASGAIGFSVAAISVEMLLVRVALVAIKRLERLTNFFRVFGILTSIILLILAFNSLVAAWQMQTFRAGLPFTLLNPMISGFLLSLTNPLHLPFWLGWTAFLRSKKILTDRSGSYNLYIIAIGAGTSAAFCIYGLAGGYLIQLLGSKQVLLNWIVGIALLITAVGQMRNTFFKKWKPAVAYDSNDQ
ncbi:LysE family transporter [Puia dinghuensis]|uniref:Lysine transporter LysE n=1 Tax=Puia dinghuensis TaxID=1792502 RepID=A0A8J2XUM0_9BACT|nr:LysE family transporter [Puia dinghuensis]GGB12583.1 hypothetical protein GCM10011511_40260 [Puia dinghuensis]